MIIDLSRLIVDGMPVFPGDEQLLNVKSFEVIALPLHIKSDSSIARVIAEI
ncbi:hypothetical protein [Paenibacillus fonticola]|uniref:hypothetical protein n=1 Tax=Paenibacillus fonticola TaxID=379896 RepID=UPI000367072B|nr:hypothetical protein [Paenibacillus fonticola]